MNDDLINKVESLKIMLVSRATAGRATTSNTRTCAGNSPLHRASGRCFLGSFTSAATSRSSGVSLNPNSVGPVRMISGAPSSATNSIHSWQCWKRNLVHRVIQRSQQQCRRSVPSTFRRLGRKRWSAEPATRKVRSPPLAHCLSRFVSTYSTRPVQRMTTVLICRNSIA